MFYFGVHKFQLGNHQAASTADDDNDLSDAEHVTTVDHPAGQMNVSIKRHVPNTHKFSISTNFSGGNNNTTNQNDGERLGPWDEEIEEFGIRYSVSVWCGDIEVRDIKHQETRVMPNTPFVLCVVDLSESLNDGRMAEEGTYLRVSLNVVLTDDEDDDDDDDDDTGADKKQHRRSRGSTRRRSSLSGKKTLRPWELLAWQAFWFIAAKLIEGRA
mmetsp:Transcript_32711/g.68579  ORF Transcript_32711/g.68579 Transcript_32711/m.68579 type:complete len:214 (+) Transcript_32711:96-737(+)